MVQRLQRLLQLNFMVKEWSVNKDLIDKDNNNVMDYVVLQGSPISTIALERT
jgi:hypothetical protein